MQTFFKTILFSLLLLADTGYSEEKTVSYVLENERSNEEATAYSKMSNTSNRYLMYRDIPELIKKYHTGDKVALDFGSGTGISSQFLKHMGFTVTGVDISKEMIALAKIMNPDVEYHQIKDRLPFEPKTYDLVFSSLVLFEIGNEKDILKYLEEAKKVMKDNSTLVLLTGSEDMYVKNWHMFENKFPQNKNLKSGDIAKVKLTELNLEFVDYFWTEADLRNFLSKAGFKILEIYYPKGLANESYPWKDELVASPFVIIIAKKSEAKAE